MTESTDKSERLQPVSGNLGATAGQGSLVDERLRGIVDRVTYHNDASGWSVLRLSSFDHPGELLTVTVHQTRVIAGATMEFTGAWIEHPRYGRQFKAKTALEKKPATVSALEKYLGSGLIRGVGPKIARKIVKHFGQRTLDIFESDMAQLMEIPGIAQKKLQAIRCSWEEHRAVRDVMIFLQSHGISTLFSVRIFKQYGPKAIALIEENPYRLATDFYGIGFFTADRVALSLGFAQDSHKRITAAIAHELAASREQGHCYLTREQITTGVNELLRLRADEQAHALLTRMAGEKQLMVRQVQYDGEQRTCYYSNTLYHEELLVARRLRSICGQRSVDLTRVAAWLKRLEAGQGFQLSPEQAQAVTGIVAERCSVMTGGPGCGKTTTTRILVRLLHAMGCSVLLAAPTGRAAQRMREVIGHEARTIHRLLEVQGNRFQRCAENPLECDFLIIDECSMLDISLSASLLRAIGRQTSLLLIGDQDQLPAVGAGNVLRDVITSGSIPCFHLHTVFRQARESAIIRFAHAVNQGQMPKMESPFKRPEIWKESDCFFMDAEEATQSQLHFIARVKRQYASIKERELLAEDLYGLEGGAATYQPLEVPEQFRHVDIQTLATADSASDQLLAVLKKVHPWSSLYWGMTARDVVRKLYTEWIPKYHPSMEIQILCPMIRGSLGSAALNRDMQAAVNPARENKGELMVGEKLLRAGDRVIHRKNNYELGVFNGDIGTITRIDNTDLSAEVCFFPDHRRVEYHREALTELDLAYAITVHKSQGSEFDVVILPLVPQHFRMLYRNLLYTGLTRAKKLAVLVGARRALAMAVRNEDTARRQTLLTQLLQER